MAMTTMRALALSFAACATLACSTSGSSTASGTAGNGSTGAAANSGAAGVNSGAAGTNSGAGGMTGVAGTTGSGTAGTGGTAGAGGTMPVGGTNGVFSCTPGVQELIVTDCGYPNTTSPPLTTTVFNENEVLRAIRPAGSWPNGVVQMFYSDEHAMTLGVHQVIVKSSSGMTMTDYPVTPLTMNPDSTTNAETGTNMLIGDQSGLDGFLRPMWPVLYITDITNDPANRAGDWQMGGRPSNPNAVFGTWKGAVRTVDNTKNPATVTITPDADPAKNNWNLGPGADPVPAGLAGEGYSAEARWNVTLTPGRSYRLQVLVHDGDQNKVGGDSGEGCVLFCAGGCTDSDGCPSTGTGGTGGNSCPEATLICGPGGVAPSACPSGTICANGCCLPNPQ